MTSRGFWVVDTLLPEIEIGDAPAAKIIATLTAGRENNSAIGVEMGTS